MAPAWLLSADQPRRDPRVRPHADQATGANPACSSDSKTLLENDASHDDHAIRPGDRAIISDVLYRDIHIEHLYDRLVDFRVLSSRYSKDSERGIIRRIHLQNIRCIANLYNTPSLIGGGDAEHPVEDIIFEDVLVGDIPVPGPDALHLFTSHVRGIVYR